MLSDETKSQMKAHVESLPKSLQEALATEDDIHQFELDFGKIPDEFRWFLLNCGSGIIGSERLDGIKALTKSHKKFRAESVNPNGWKLKDFFLIGWDGSGNLFGIETRTGKVVTEDHNFGGIHEIAPSFEAFLLKAV
jgi:hypothetical protein